LTAPPVAVSSDADTNAFEVGVEPSVVDGVPVRDDDAADLWDLGVVTEVDSVVDRVLDPDFGDLEVFAVEEPLL